MTYEVAVTDALSRHYSWVTAEPLTLQVTERARDGTAQHGALGAYRVEHKMAPGAFVYVSGQSTSSDGRGVSCRITVNGQAVASNSSTGQYTIATCEGTVR